MSRAGREEESKLLGPPLPAPPGPKKLASEGPSWEGWGRGSPWSPKPVMGLVRRWVWLGGGRCSVLGVVWWWAWFGDGWGSVMGGA